MLSVLVRSIGRSSLERALHSISIQNKKQLLVVLVDAKGDLYEAIPEATELVDQPIEAAILASTESKQLTLRLGVTKSAKGLVRESSTSLRHRESVKASFRVPGWPDLHAYPFNILIVSTGQSLERATAADLALKIGACVSDRSIFLDDDDTFLHGHLDVLESALMREEDAVLVHTAALLTFEASSDIAQSSEHQIGKPFEPWELLYANHIPIHCALFRTELIRRKGLSFDSQFKVYEDWDFWLQLQSLGRFVWVPGCSARYFVSDAVGRSSKVHQIARDDDSYQRLWQKWLGWAPSDWWFDLLARTGPDLNRLEALEQTIANLGDVNKVLETQLGQSAQISAAQQQAIDDLRRALETQFGENQSLHDELASAGREAHKLREAIKKQEQDLAHLIQQSAQREQALRIELSTAYDAAEQWRRRAESFATLSTQLQQQIQAILQSRSWRVTKPLRQLGTIARRLGMAKLYRRVRALHSHASVALTPRSQVDQNSQADVANLFPRQESESESNQDQAHTQSKFVRTSGQLDPYQHWITRFESKHYKDRSISFIEKSAKNHQSSQGALISIVMPIFNAPLNFFKAAIVSVQKQHNPNWELCVADDASTDKESLIWLKQEMLRDSRIKLVERSQNGHIVACSNSALALATADWIALMDQDDLLSPYAIVEVLSAIEQYPNAMLIYSDEDKVNNNGLRSDPYFKPAFNLELLRAQNTFSHLGVYRRSLVNAVGGFQPGTEGSQDHDLVLRCIEHVNADQVIHIPKVLYHWRIHDQSTASAVDAKPYAVTNGLKAVNQHLARTSPGAEAFLHQSISHYIVRYPLPVVLPNVDIIIPTRNGFEVLDRCLESLFKLTHYPRMKVTVIDNGSDDIRVINLLQDYKERKLIDVLRYDKAFNFSAINNFAVENTSADYLLFLNNDIEIIRADWLDELLRQGCRDEIGAVGAMLWYPDMTMQHAGVVIGAGGVAGHAHHRLPVGHPGYFGRAAFALEVCAVTAACLLMPRKLFIELGGFDEESLAVAFNDVDLCLRLRRLGYKVIFTPRAELIHHESATRGDDLSPEHRDRFERECAVMRHRWSAAINNDPSYNPNLEMMSSTFQAYAEPRDCSARSSQLPSG